MTRTLSACLARFEGVCQTSPLPARPRLKTPAIVPARREGVDDLGSAVATPSHAVGATHGAPAREPSPRRTERAAAPSSPRRAPARVCVSASRRAGTPPHSTQTGTTRRSEALVTEK